jgi:hypothetical protein
MKLVYSNSIGTRVIKGVYPAIDVSYYIEDRTVINAGSATYTTDSDANVVRNISNGATTNFKITAVESPIFKGLSFFSETPEIASVDSTGLVTYVSNGTANIIIQSPAGSRRVSRLISSTSTATIFDSWIVGTLAKHITDNINTLILGKIYSSNTTDMYVGVGVDTYSPNSANFAHTLDMSCFSTSQYSRMVLVSPSCVIGSHTSLRNTGDTITFRSSTGVYETRSIISSIAFSTNTENASDQNFICKLNTPITSISPAKLLSSLYPAKLICAARAYNNTGSYPIQMLRTKQAGGLNRIELIEGNINTDNTVQLRKSVNTPYSEWSSLVEGGDSNGVIFVPINGEVVLVSSMNNVGGGRNFWSMSGEINANINTLAGESVTYANISGFI